MAFMSAGEAVRDYGPFGAPKPKPKPTPLQNQYQVYDSAVKQQAGDYDTIMSGYKNLRNSPLMNNYQSLLDRTRSGGQASFQNTADARASISNLGDLARTGGLSTADQNNIRARGISPIRAVYGNAQRNVNRQKNLQGGYSPNHGAVTSKMAREMSEQIAGATTKVNADLAEMIQRGRLSAAPSYASAAGAERDGMNQMEMFNKRDLPGYEKSILDSMTGIESDALRGMTSLYGTTPALSQLFGNQALASAQTQNNITQQNQNRGMQTINQLMASLR